MKRVWVCEKKVKRRLLRRGILTGCILLQNTLMASSNVTHMDISCYVICCIEHYCHNKLTLPLLYNVIIEILKKIVIFINTNVMRGSGTKLTNPSFSRWNHRRKPMKSIRTLTRHDNILYKIMILNNRYGITHVWKLLSYLHLKECTDCVFYLYIYKKTINKVIK